MDDDFLISLKEMIQNGNLNKLTRVKYKGISKNIYLPSQLIVFN